MVYLNQFRGYVKYRVIAPPELLPIVNVSLFRNSVVSHVLSAAAADKIEVYVTQCICEL